MKNVPATQQQMHPLHHFGGKRSGAELASHVSVGDGAVSEAGEGVL